MNIHRAVLPVLGGMALTLLLAAPANADPKGADIIELECEVLGTIDVAVFSNGPLSPGLVVGSNQVIIPYAIHIEGTFTPSDGGDPQTFEDDTAHPAPRHGRLDTCTFSEVETSEFGTAEFGGVVEVSYTPSR